MPRQLHYRAPGDENVGCGGSANTNWNTNFTLDVTCEKCQRTTAFKQAHSAFMEVVEALASPKEEHPVLSKLGHPDRRKK
jgi:hypothetical protein